MPEPSHVVKVTLDITRDFETLEQVYDYAATVAAWIDAMEHATGVRVKSSVTVNGVTVSIPR